MAQRLVRAKKRIRDAGIPFALPERDDLAERLPAVLEAVYGAYAIDWQLTPAELCDRHPVGRGAAPGPGAGRPAARRTGGSRPRRAGLSVRIAAAAARRDGGGGFVPLDEQDTTRWDTTLIARGEALLRRAHEFGAPGRFQYEAAIQSAHCARAQDGPRRRRSAAEAAPGRAAGGAVAGDGGGFGRGGRRCRRAGRGAARPRRDQRSGDRDGSSRRGRRGRTCWPQAGRTADAAEAYRRAIELTTDPAVADYLARGLRQLSR